MVPVVGGRAERRWLCARRWGEGPRGTREAGEGPGSERSATSVTGREPIPSLADSEGAALCREEAAGKRRPFLLRSWSSFPKTCQGTPDSPDPPETGRTVGSLRGRPASLF